MVFERRRWVRAAWLIGVVVSAVVSFAAVSISGAQSGGAAPVPASVGAWPEWLSFSNMLSAAVLIFHFGTLRSEAEDARRRTAKLEQWRDEVAPEVFARQDRTKDACEQIARRLARIDARLDL